MSKKPYLSLFLTFLRIGAFTFGGGYAMIPLIKAEAAEKKHWIDDEDLLEIITIAESTPGPIAINAATFIGQRVGGFFGAVCATMGVVLPSFLIIFAISFFLEIFKNLRPVQYAFFGLRAGVLALILKALWNMYQKVSKGLVEYLLMAAALIATAFFDLPVIAVLAGCAAVGLLAALRAERRRS